MELEYTEAQLGICPVLSLSFLEQLIVQLFDPVEALGVRQLLGREALVEYCTAYLRVLELNQWLYEGKPRAVTLNFCALYPVFYDYVRVHIRCAYQDLLDVRGRGHVKGRYIVLCQVTQRVVVLLS